MKRRKQLWIVVGAAAAGGIALAYVTSFVNKSNSDAAFANAAKYAPAILVAKQGLDGNVSKPTTEQIKKLIEVKDSGKEAQAAGGVVAEAWLQRMYDHKLADSAPEFRELVAYLLTVDPSSPRHFSEMVRTAKSPEERAYPMQVLLAFGKPAVPALVAAMEEDARKAGDNYLQASRSQIPPALAKFVPDSFADLRGALKNPAPAVRCQALRTVALMGVEGKERVVEMVPDVELALSDKDKSVRAFAALTLAELAPPKYEPKQSLKDALHDPDHVVSLAAARTLGRLQAVNVQDVSSIVADMLKGEPFKDTWWNVVGKPPTIIASYAPLKGGTDYNELFWEETAAHVFLGLGQPQTLTPERIVELLRGCRNDGRHLMTLLAARGSRASSVVKELANMSKDPDYLQRRKALLALAKLGKNVAEEALPDVKAALNHRDGRTRWLALLTLLQLDPAAVRDRYPASMHSAIDAGSGTLSRASLSGVTNWTRSLWEDCAEVLVPATNATASADAAGIYRTPTDLDVLAENDRIDNMLSVLAKSKSLGKESVPFLLDAWQGTEKKEAFNILVAIGPAGLPALTKILDDPDAKEMHLKVLEVLQAFGTKAKPAVGSLVKAVAGPNEDVCEKAAKVLGGLGADAKEAIPGLQKQLQSKNMDTRRHAADALGEIGASAKPALPDLIDLFGSDNSQLRVVAVRAVSGIGKDAVEPLTKVLQTSNSREQVKLDAIRALARLKEEPQSALPALRALAENDPSTEVKTEADALVKKLQPKTLPQ